ESLVRGYVMKYPREKWPVESTEEAVTFPVLEETMGVAKLDGYFYVPEDTTVESGLPGSTITLSRGWWSREYKTKSPGVHRPTWIEEWSTKRQADFQLLALKDLLTRKGHNPDEVQGVMVSVLEKPREYTPKRKCKGCGETFELGS